MKTIIAIIAFIAALAIASAVAINHGSVAGILCGLAAFAIGAAANNKREAALFANNFGVLNNTILIFDAFSQFLEAMLPLRNLVLDVQDEKSGAVEGKPGDVITLKDWRTTVTPYQPVAGVYAPPVDINVSAKDRQVTLPNAPWAVSFSLTAAEFRTLASGMTKGADYETFRNKLRNLMVQGLGQKCIDLWFAVITTANFPDISNKFVSAPGTFGRSAEVDLDTKLFGRNVTTEGAQVIASPAFYGEWVKDHLAIQTNTGGAPQTPLLMEGGHKSANSNFTMWRTNRPMPANAARAFATTKTGVIGAFRVPDEATFENDPVSLNTLIAPVTGIPLLSRLWKNPSTGAIQLDLATMPVFAKGQEEAIERIEAA